MKATRGQVPTLHFSTLWLPELLACLGTIVSLVGIVALIAIYDNKPVFHWKGVTLNAAVSVLSTASKSLLMLAVEESISQWKWILFWRDRRLLIDFERVDEASRGPWGSFIALWRLKKP
jgi:hypothetical protein